MTIHKSIKTWTVAILVVDLLFWLYLLGFGCAMDRVSCSETIMFGSWFYYLSFTLLPLAIPPFVWEVAHVALAVVVGWLLRHHPVHWLIAFVVTGVVVFGTIYGFGHWQMQLELKRETATQFWMVDQASTSAIQFHTAQQVAANTFKADAGQTSFNLAAFDTKHTQVKLLTCDQTNCTEQAVSYRDYLAANTACKKDQDSCAYYQLGKSSTLFEVTFNPKQIILMRQIDQR